MSEIKVIKKGEKKPVSASVVKLRRKSHFDDMRRRFNSVIQDALKKLDELEQDYASLEQ